MSNEIVFDIETCNTFEDAGERGVKGLEMSMVCAYFYQTNEYKSYRKEQLQDFFREIEKADRTIGYNSEHFDLPVLNNYYQGDLLKFPHLDILKEIKNVLGFRLKLNDLAKATLNEEKSGYGLQAIEWYKRGEWNKIEKYCIDDVRITKDIYEFGLKNKQLFFTDLVHRSLRPFPVNFAMPLKATIPSNVNLTLPF